VSTLGEQRDKAKQRMKGVEVKGRAMQISDVASTDQNAENIKAASMRQRISAKLPTLTVGGRYSATGVVALVALVVIVVAGLVTNFLIV
jgi:hypothetical protein